VFLLCVMWSSTTAERQSLASRDRTCCLRRCLPARPLRYSGFRGSIAHPTQSLCTLRTRRRRRPRNTCYRAPATAYPDRSLTGRTTPACLAHKQSIAPRRKYGLLRCARNDEEDKSAISRRDAPELLHERRPSRSKRAQGMPGARCTHGPLCNKKHRGRNHRYTGSDPASPAQRFYGLYLLSPVTMAWLPPSPARRVSVFASLSACFGAPGPHDFAVRGKPSSEHSMSLVLPARRTPDQGESVVRRTTLPRPSHPTPRSVTIAIRPSCRGGTGGDIDRSGARVKRNIFAWGDWTTQISLKRLANFDFWREPFFRL
jgi:hypothetical protein